MGLTPRVRARLFACNCPHASQIFRTLQTSEVRRRFPMILRNAMTCLFGIGCLLLVADSCAASPFPGGRPLRDRAAGYELTVLVDGVPARTFMHDGETYVLGQLGSHYTLRVSNHTGRRIEAVVSVRSEERRVGKECRSRGAACT